MSLNDSPTRGSRFGVLVLAVGLVAVSCGRSTSNVQASGSVETTSSVTSVEPAAQTPAAYGGECTGDDARISSTVDAVFTTPFWAGVDPASPSSISDVAKANPGRTLQLGTVTAGNRVEAKPFTVLPDGGPDAPNAGVVWGGYELTIETGQGSVLVAVPMSAGPPQLVEQQMLDAPAVDSLTGTCVVVLPGQSDAGPLDTRASQLLAIAGAWTSAPIAFGPSLTRALSATKSLGELAPTP